MVDDHAADETVPEYDRLRPPLDEWPAIGRRAIRAIQGGNSRWHLACRPSGRAPFDKGVMIA
jgi:hypothetical protein